ncbi:MAG: DNA alkylation repair protein [Marinisporobacter sp.]|jgi:3-methyladenine DNA glycosylase AlkD|nr:DNA alkylation repair protein [Marinisporobacter sp.]
MSIHILKIRKKLESLAEPKYQKFASSLIPGCDHLIGVRIPAIRKIAKGIAKENPIEYLDNAEDLYFEETMLQALVIGQMKEDIEIVLEQVVLFVPKIKNWSHCDSFCTDLKIVREHKERVWKFIQSYWQSDEPYEIRFAVVMMLRYYIEEKYLHDLFLIFDRIKNDNYYVKMAVAWAISMCFVKYPDETMTFLNDNHLDDATYNKALQKIRESLKVDKSTKEIIKSMKR